MVGQPRNSQDEGVLAEGGYEGSELLPVPANIQGHADEFCDVSREDGLSVNYFEGRWDTEGVLGQIVLAYKLLVYKGEARGSTVEERMSVTHADGAGPRAVTEAGRRAVTNKATSRGRRESASGLSGVPR